MGHSASFADQKRVVSPLLLSASVWVSISGPCMDMAPGHVCVLVWERRAPPATPQRAHQSYVRHQAGCVGILYSGAPTVRGRYFLSETWEVTVRKMVVALLHAYLQTASGRGSAFKHTCVTGKKEKEQKQTRNPLYQEHTGNPDRTDADSGQ